MRRLVVVHRGTRPTPGIIKNGLNLNMLRNLRHLMLFHVSLVAMLLLAVSTAGAASAKPVRLFILSGQSNMAGLKEDESFTPRVKAAFPDDEVIVAKYARSGQLIRMWYKDWKAPEGAEVRGQGKNGRHYDTLMETVKQATAGKPQPISITFVWMQGEADANHKGYGEIYANALAKLLNQLQADLGRQDVDMVIGRICDFGNNDPENRPGWNLIREVQVKFADEQPKQRAWVDTDDLNGKADGLHFTREGYQTLGERFADAAIRLIRQRDDATTKPAR
jgi:hypothetical protein